MVSPPEVTDHTGMGGGITWETFLGGSVGDAYFYQRFRPGM
jgi:hypothetical protein